MKSLTQSRLKELLHYDADTGIFTWKQRSAQCVRVGDIAGRLDEYGYIIIKITGKAYRAHRLAWFYMTGEWPKQIDHINHVRVNNAWINLREVTQQENCRNTSKRKDNTSRVTGVSWCKRDKAWRANIRANGKQVGLGYFNDWFLSVCARKSAENKYNYHPNHGRA